VPEQCRLFFFRVHIRASGVKIHTYISLFSYEITSRNPFPRTYMVVREEGSARATEARRGARWPVQGADRLDDDHGSVARTVRTTGTE
jgi:hypothetical protein